MILMATCSYNHDAVMVAMVAYVNKCDEYG